MNTRRLDMLAGHSILLRVGQNESDPLAWTRENREDVEQFLSTNGALLIRGLGLNRETFGPVLTELFGEDLLRYTFRSTPRTSLEKNVYTATEYHASEVIPQHNENSYAHAWPLRIGFLCTVPASRMGNTPISDSRVAFREIPREIREEFERKKVMYVRNYSDIDLPWTEVFQTGDTKEVEKFCAEHNITCQWTENGLRTKQTNQATLEHPVTGEKLWFNQAHLFHASNLEDDLREGLLDLLGEENLPRNTYFGDGTPIPEEALAVIREVYEKTKFSFQWEQNDLLLLDNMLFTHGREPYEGPRQVLVGMARDYCPERALRGMER